MRRRKPQLKSKSPNHALKRIRRERRGCNRCVPCAGSLSLGRSSDVPSIGCRCNGGRFMNAVLGRIGIVGAVILVGILSSLFGCSKHGAGRSDSANLADVYTGLRNQVLQLRTTGQPAGLVALLMETGYPETVATLVAVSDGTTSLYFSNGGGIIGAGEHDSVRSAASALLRLAAQHSSVMVETNEFPLPAVGRVRFYLITSGRVLAAEADEHDLGYNRAAMSPVFHQAHEVIAAVREHSPK